MSKTILIIFAVFIMFTQIVMSQAERYKTNLYIEPVKYKEMAYSKSRCGNKHAKSSLTQQSMKLITNIEFKFNRFKSQEYAWTLSAQSSYRTLILTLIALLMILTFNSSANIQKTSLFLIFFLCLSAKGAKAIVSSMTASCLGCPGCISTNSCYYYCSFGYYYNSGICYFYENMPGCTSANGRNCVFCLPNYYLSSSYICTLCYSTIPNCQTCTSASTCSQCTNGYAINPTSYTCDICSLNITNCVACISKYVCTTCIDQTYFVNETFRCQLCIYKKFACRKCIPSACTQCIPGYTVVNSTCLLCSNLTSGCATCINSTFCTSCINTAFIYVGNTCIPCGNVFPFCQNCTPTVCTTCEASFFLNTNSQCQCKKGSLIDGECIDIAGCNAAIKYKNQSYCTQCDQSIFKFNTSTLKCDCINGFLLNYQCSFLYGCITMIMVSNKQTCLMCNMSRHFTVKNGQCSCNQGYYLERSNNACYQTCGDGIMYYLQCDDGNLIDGDGCNSQCEIEESFICIGGNQNSSSHCLNIVENFELKVQEIENVGEYNIAKFQFRIVNFIQFLHTLNWTKLFYLEIGKQHNVTSISITGNKVTFIVEYFEDLEGFPAVFHLNLSPEYFLYPKVISLPFLMVSQTAPLVLNEFPNELILDILSKVLFALSILSLLLLLFAPCVHKMIALETITVLQLCNLAPFLIPGDSLTIRVFSSLSLSNGFGRQLFTDPNTSETFGTVFQHMSLAKTFTQNMLINEFFLLVVVLVFIILYFLKEKMKGREAAKKTRNNIYHFAYVYSWNLVFSVALALLLFSLIALNCNNHRVYERTYGGITYESTKKYQIFNSTANLLSVFTVLPLIASVGFINIFAFSSQTNVLRQSKSKVIRIICKEIERLNVKRKIYVSMFVANLFVSFASLSGFFFIAFDYKVFVYFLASLPFAMILMVYRPYNKAIDNFGVCLGQFTSLIFVSGLCAKQCFRILKVPLSLKYEFYFCIGIVFLLTIFVVTSITRFFSSWLWYLDLLKQVNKTKRKKKSDTKKFSQEKVVMQLEGQKKKDYFFNRPKFSEISAVDHPELQKIKERLRDNLFEKRNLQKTIKTLFDPFDPIRQVLM